VRQCVAVCCSVLQRHITHTWSCVVVCCDVLQCVAACCNVLQRVAVCCSVLQCVAVCCSVLQCVTAPYHTYLELSPDGASSNTLSANAMGTRTHTVTYLPG